MSEELKPCPFCKREAQQTASSGLVSCAFENCPAFLLAVPADNWNRRAQPAEAEGVVPVVGYLVDVPDEPELGHWYEEEAEEEGEDLGPPLTRCQPLVRQADHLAALSAVTAERDAALAENARLIEDRARFPDKPDDIGKMIRAHIGNLKIGKEQAESYARKWAAEADLLRKDAARWRYVSLQGDDTHWLNLLRVDLEDFGGNINAAVDALIDGEAPAVAAKEE